MNENTTPESWTEDDRCGHDGLTDHFHLGTAALEPHELAEVDELEALVAADTMIIDERGDLVADAAAEQADEDEDAPVRARRSRERKPARDLSSYLKQHLADLESLPTYRPTIGCVIPAYNEAESIEAVLRSLLAQTRLPDQIHVIVNNTKDATFDIAARFAGPRKGRKPTLEEKRRGIKRGKTEVFVHDIGENPDKKVGALNYGYALIDGSGDFRADYLLGVDGDTTLAVDAVEKLEAEICSDSRIGGISAIYSIDDSVQKGLVAPLLIAGQRAQFAAFNMQNMLRGRNMAVLGGQCSIFSMKALREVMTANHQKTPWVNDSEVEDSLLSLQIKSAGYLTKISATARADVGGMTTLRSLDGQQVKWNYGAIDLMWPGQRGDTKGQPFHPNLRLRWAENVGMLTNIFTRIAFVLLLAAALSIHAFVFSPLWLIPPAVAILLNVRIAMSMKNRTWKDIVFAATGIPAELYMWLRAGHFLRAWSKFLSKVKTDNWAEQAKAERGSGNSYLMPLVILLVSFVALAITWLQMPTVVQSTVLWLGWPVLYVVTIAQTVVMAAKLFRRQHGYRV
ncbi:cellulose synthase/poly-beta-1,6-N-acetylglucosamine synthase-like glycosyltransferase [Friedmanniella endophytica]|uniref:Cellulose synthase/poly-beta-1,6-N-acetylglucosamine synthase-like glycosyltransferase n=1 Tax=Microlunatus kandeliicorticis TaxID=1759536 RepID=A0A7W3IR88_9ACTN|nr:glycosyltransferase family 2 protein [Microlunatus kandeliicorticis]MBA8793772.1 cellulose synthase/poly-beta-1,6-N-acetylglucosamine synthase-like glycosyltransferase [Microlunatus kandeliicorticis]